MCCIVENLLPLDVVSINPISLVFQEPISYPMENHIINDMYGNTLPSFGYQYAINGCNEVQQKDRDIFIAVVIFFIFFGLRAFSVK